MNGDITTALNELEEARRKLSQIEKIARAAFNNPETFDIDLHRAQALAKIFAIFEQGYEEA